VVQAGVGLAQAGCYTVRLFTLVRRSNFQTGQFDGPAA
jgi:hypothetical protein